MTPTSDAYRAEDSQIPEKLDPQEVVVALANAFTTESRVLPTTGTGVRSMHSPWS